MTKDPKKLISKGLSSGSVRGRITGIFFYLISSLVLVFILTGDTSDISTGELIWIWVLYIIFGGAGLTAVLASYDHVFNKRPILRAIEENDPNFIVWIYPFISKSGVASVYAYDRNGKLSNIKLKKDYHDTVINYLGECFPNAKVGYKEEYKKILRSNPEELLRPNPQLRAEIK